jgi:DNA-directed RNA polymerase subunit RPC12/RpoP
MTEEINTSFTEDPVCPYCGHEETDSHEISQDETVVYCSKCGKKYAIDQEFSRTFCSYETCQPDEPHQFGEWRPYGAHEIRTCKVCSTRQVRKGAS